MSEGTRATGGGGPTSAATARRRAEGDPVRVTTRTYILRCVRPARVRADRERAVTVTARQGPTSRWPPRAPLLPASFRSDQVFYAAVGRCAWSIAAKMWVSTTRSAWRSSGDAEGRSSGQEWSQQAAIDFGVEDGDVDAVGGEHVRIRMGPSSDQAFAAQTPQIVGHLRRAVLVPSRPATWARRLRLVKPVTALRVMHKAPTRAIVRGSPKRKAPVRWPSSIEGSATRSKSAVETAQPWPAR